MTNQHAQKAAEEIYRKLGRSTNTDLINEAATIIQTHSIEPAVKERDKIFLDLLKQKETLERIKKTYARSWMRDAATGNKKLRGYVCGDVNCFEVGIMLNSIDNAIHAVEQLLKGKQ